VQRHSLIAQIEQRLEESGINAVVEESDGVITVSGVVASAEARQAAEDIVAAAAPNERIDYSLEVETVLPVDVGDFDADEPSAELAETAAEIREQGGEMEPDFTDQSMLEDPTAASGASSSSGAEDVVEAGDDVYVPPTDPVVTSDEQDQTQVLGGFQSTSMDCHNRLDHQRAGSSGRGALAWSGCFDGRRRERRRGRVEGPWRTRGGRRAGGEKRIKGPPPAVSRPHPLPEAARRRVRRRSG
jgi:hypothetical protein